MKNLLLYMNFVQVGECSSLLSNPLDSSLSISVADDFLRKRLAKRNNNNNFLEDHREVTIVSDNFPDLI